MVNEIKSKIYFEIIDVLDNSINNDNNHHHQGKYIFQSFPFFFSR